MKNKHFLHISDYSKEELWEILELAKSVKAKFRKREDYPHFRNKSLSMIFAKPSARTRVSFETGFEWMGGPLVSDDGFMDSGYISTKEHPLMVIGGVTWTHDSRHRKKDRKRIISYNQHTMRFEVLPSQLKTERSFFPAIAVYTQENCEP